MDLDSDNDGLTDTIEADGEDSNGDGVIDGFTDLNGDGMDDGAHDEPLPVEDFDGDGVRDFRDQDSDNDGLTDTMETQGASADRDRDGEVDGFMDENRNGLDDSLESMLTRVVPEDIDSDGLPDYLDIDTDGDGILDLVEAGGIDINNDGIVDSMADSDNDGIPDSVDVDLTAGADADGDGIDDSADSDFVMGATDTDGDGIIDTRDPDIDGDGLANFLNDGTGAFGLQAALPDVDQNGVPDVQEANADGIVLTGLSGSGCSVGKGTQGTVDPTLPLLITLSCVCLGWRRRGALGVQGIAR